MSTAPTSPAAPESQSLSQRLRQVHIGTRHELEISRHVMRGRAAYVVHDPVTFRAHQLSARDYQIFVSLDDNRPLADTFAQLVERGVLHIEHEDEFYQYILQLNQIGLLNLPVTDGKALYARFERKRKSQLQSAVRGFLFLRVPLWNPDGFLNRTRSWFAPLFSTRAFALWSLGVLISLVIISLQWRAFCDPLGTMLAFQNLPLLWTLLVGLKIIHEFGHAYACKHFGGKVPEMGAYFIMFTPCAYLDATAAWGFPSRRQRIVVSLAGMYFESIIAMVALLVWAMTGPTFLHSMAQYVVVLSTVVTIGFNVNPLMKYDGYFVLCDLVNVPNLRAVAGQQLQVFTKEWLFGLKTRHVARTTASRIGLATFGLISAGYKWLVLVGIGMLIAYKIPVVGLVAASVFIGTSLWKSLRQLHHYVWRSEELASVRRRAVWVTSGLLAAATAGLLLLPAPGSLQTMGVVGREADRVVRAQAAGFLQRTQIEVGQPVAAGDVLCQLTNLDMEEAVRKKQADIEDWTVQLHWQLTHDPVAASEIQQQLAQADRDLRHLRDRQSELLVVAPITGNLASLSDSHDDGRFVNKGEPLGLVSAGPWIVKALASEETMSDWHPRIGDHVEVRLAGQAGHTMSGRVVQVAQAGSHTIQETALTHLAGGDIVVHNTEGESQHPYFQIKIVIDEVDAQHVRHGMLAYATFRGQRQTLAQHLVRRTLQFVNGLRVAG